MDKDLTELIGYVENATVKDKIVLALHVVLLSQGYQVDLPMQKVGNMVVKAVLPNDWRDEARAEPTYYSLTYTHPQAQGKELEVKASVENGKLVVYASRINEDSALTEFELPILASDSTAQDLIDSAKKALANAGDPDFLFETRKKKKLEDRQVSSKSESASASAARGSADPAPGGGQAPPRRPNPDFDPNFDPPPFNPPPLPFGGVPAPHPDPLKLRIFL